jgi:hypothetical protein
MVYLGMIFSKKISRIKKIQLKNYDEEEFLEEEFSFLLTCLTQENSDGVYTAALLALIESSNKALDFLLEHYLTLQDHAQMLGIPMLACTDYVACYIFLLKRLKESQSSDEVALIVLALASTHYYVVPLLVNELISDNQEYLKRLKIVFRQKGFKQVFPYLMMRPEVPFESFFRDVFGDSNIDKIKQKT